MIDDPAQAVAAAIRALVVALTEHRSGGIGAGADLAARQSELAEALRQALAAKRKAADIGDAA